MCRNNHLWLRFDASSLAILAIVFQTSLESQNHVVELLFRGEKASEPDVRFKDFPMNATRSTVLDNLGHQVINDSLKAIDNYLLRSLWPLGTILPPGLSPKSIISKYKPDDPTVIVTLTDYVTKECGHDVSDQVKINLAVQCKQYYTKDISGSNLKIMHQCIRSVCSPPVILTNLSKLNPAVDINQICPDLFIQTVRRSNFSECAVQFPVDVKKQAKCAKMVCANATAELSLPQNFNASMFCLGKLNEYSANLTECADNATHNNSFDLTGCILEICPFIEGPPLIREPYGMLKVCTSEQMMAFVEQLGKCVMAYGGDIESREQCQKLVCEQPVPDFALKLMPTRLILYLIVLSLFDFV